MLSGGRDRVQGQLHAQAFPGGGAKLLFQGLKPLKREQLRMGDDKNHAGMETFLQRLEIVPQDGMVAVTGGNNHKDGIRFGNDVLQLSGGILLFQADGIPELQVEQGVRRVKKVQNPFMGVWGGMRPVLPADQCGFTGHAGTEPFPGQGVQRRGFAGPCHADDGDILRRAAFGQGFLHLFLGIEMTVGANPGGKRRGGIRYVPHRMRNHVFSSCQHGVMKSGLRPGCSGFPEQTYTPLFLLSN